MLHDDLRCTTQRKCNVLHARRSSISTNTTRGEFVEPLDRCFNITHCVIYIVANDLNVVWLRVSSRLRQWVALAVEWEVWDCGAFQTPLGTRQVIVADLYV
jgi:hypothetical protein